MSEKIKAIRGSKERAEEVKQWLRNQGATDIEKCFFDNEYRVYFVDNNKCVRSCPIKDEILFDVAELPVKKPLLKVISGNTERSKEVIQALEDMGGINTNNMTGDALHCYYYINSAKCICHKKMDDSFFDNYVLEVLILPKKPTLKVIRGVDSPCQEGERIIATLESLGGYNKCLYIGDAGCDSCYYINNENVICCVSIDNLNKKYELEFLELPEEEKIVVPSLEAQEAIVVEQKEILEAYINGETIERCPKAGAIRTFEEIEAAGHLFNFCLYNYTVKSKRWRAESGEMYYYILTNGEVATDIEYYGEYDNTSYAFGNYFRTEEEAEQAAKSLKKTLIKFHSENDKL